MKKTLALLLALAMSCSMLVACSEDDDSSKKETGSSVADSSVVDSSDVDSSDVDSSDVDSSDGDSSNGDSSDGDSSNGDSSNGDSPITEGKTELGDEIETEERLFETLVAELSKGTMTMEMDVEQEGLAIYVYMTTDGTNTYADVNMLGMGVTTLQTADGSYYLDTEGKRYYLDTTATDVTDDYGSIADDLIGEDQKYVKTLNVTIDGTDYVAECYEIDGSEGYFVFDANGDITAVIASNAGETMTMPVTLSAKADTSKLSLPEDYTAMTDDEFTAFYGDLTGM